MKNIDQNHQLLSLFCGAGGLDLGFENQGFNVGLAFDIRDFSVNSYNQNRESSHGYVYDINELTLDKLDELYGSEFSPIGLIGGPPCQGFSLSNVNKDVGDRRNRLAFSYARLLDKLNQRNPVHFFVFENVKGLLSPRHSNTYKNIKSKFRKCGFKLHITKLNAFDYGVPQNRERLIIVGLNSDIYEASNWEIDKPSEDLNDLPRTVRDAIAGLPQPAYFNEVRAGKKIPHHPNHWCMTPKSKKFHTEGMLPEGESFGRSFRTLYWDKPSPTVAYGNREVHVHPSGKRRLSVFEAMLLQGFPEEYRLSGNLSQQITQISEAVPIPLADSIAKSVISQLEF